MKQNEIIISGVGGQGMILCGTLLARAAAIHEHKKATLSSEYGVETRGTFAKSDVIISDEEIFYPECTEPDLIICLHQIAYERFKNEKNALIIYDSAEVHPQVEGIAALKAVDITAEAKALGNIQTANIITMGIISGYTGCIGPDAGKNSISDQFEGKSEKIINMNHKAFDRGYEIGVSLK